MSKRWRVVWAINTLLFVLVVGLDYRHEGLRAWRVALFLGLVCGAQYVAVRTDAARVRYEDALHKARRGKIDAITEKMDDAMRGKYVARRHAAWDDGDRFNPTVYAEYAGGGKKYIVRSYTLWGTMSVYEQVERGVSIQPLQTEEANG